MTEDEAKTKWCPKAITADVETSTQGNRHIIAKDPFVDNNPFYSRCIASECMMWRWVTPAPNLTDLPTHGYCGLAR